MAALMKAGRSRRTGENWAVAAAILPFVAGRTIALNSGTAIQPAVADREPVDSLEGGTSCFGVQRKPFSMAAAGLRRVECAGSTQAGLCSEVEFDTAACCTDQCLDRTPKQKNKSGHLKLAVVLAMPMIAPELVSLFLVMASFLQ